MSENPVAPGNGPEGQQGGEHGNEPASAQQSHQPAQQGEPTPPAPPAQPTSPEPSEQPGEQGLEQASHADLVAQIRELRRENAKDRTSAKETAAQQAQQEVVQQIGKALGLVEDGDNTTEASREDLLKQVAELRQDGDKDRSEAQQSKLELAVFRASSKQGADADALLDSRSFLEKIADIDPSKTADIEKAVKDAVENNPRLQNSPQTPGRSSAPLNNQRGHDGKGNESQTPGELAAKIATRTPY